MNKRVLKLPDGGTFDLPMPAGFGAPIFALNDADARKLPTWPMYVLGAGLGIFFVWILKPRA